MHGISLNVSCDLSPYNDITPCGIDSADEGRFVCNMEQHLLNVHRTNDMNSDNKSHMALIPEVAEEWYNNFGQVFELNMEKHIDPIEELKHLVDTKPHIKDLNLLPLIL